MLSSDHALTGHAQNIEEVTEDGAPSGRKDFLVWNPPLKDPMDPSLGRVHSMTEATGLMRFLMARGVRVILFCKVRPSAIHVSPYVTHLMHTRSGSPVNW